MAEEVSHFNLATLPDVTPPGMHFWISNIASPLPFHVSPSTDYCIAIYGKAPDKSYFVGCSNGGRQAMLASQRFPEYFDDR